MSTPLLYLLVRLGGDCFAIDTAHVVEIVPLLRLRAVARAPQGFAGMMNYRGAAVSVVDLNFLVLGITTESRLKTRIVITRLAASGAGVGERQLGLVVPEVLRTAHYDPDLFAQGAPTTSIAGFAGGVAIVDEEVIQLVSMPGLLSAELRDALGAAAAAA